MNLDKRLLQQARRSQAALLLTIGAGFAGGLLAVVQARFLSRIVGQVFLESYTLQGVATLLALLLGVFGLRAALIWSSEVSANVIARRVKTELRQQLYQHLLARGPVYARAERTGELTSVMVEGIEALDAYFSQYLPQLALAALVPLTFLALVFPLDALSATVLLLTAPLIPVFMILIGNAAQGRTQRQWQTLSRMSAYFLDVLQGLTTLKILGRSREQVQVIELVSERFRQTTMSVLRVTFLSALALEMVSTLSTAVVAVEVGLRLLYGRLAFEQAFFILLLAPEFYLPLRLLGTRFHAGMSGVAAAKRIFEILEGGGGIRTVQNIVDDGGQMTDDGPGKAESKRQRIGDIHFERVSFAYEDDRPALRGVTLRIPAGQKVALVGPSGGGKSTLASLLLRFVEPEQGQITLGGQPLKELSPEAWREQIAWVPQNPYLFNDTVAANIRLGSPQASLEQVMQAARQAHAHEFILELPQGYDTPVGERGARLSGGQAQRIALARAFLKDAPLVILDEATANLDPEHEALLQESLAQLLEGRTALIIAHRLNTVRRADQAAVLKDGLLVELGTHTELMQQDGLYRQLVSAAISPSSLIPHSSSNQKNPPEMHSRAIQEQPDRCSNDLPSESAVGNKFSRQSVLLRLLGLLAPFLGWVTLSVLAGFATIGSSMGLMTASAYIISAAALQPSIAELQVAIVGVRFFGIARGVFRYLERYLSHQVTFRLLARLRTRFYQALEPLAPARLVHYRSGDLLARILGDVESLENFYVRAVAPPLVAILVSLLAYAVLARYAFELGATLLGFLLIAGVVVPWLIRQLSRKPGQASIQQRSALNAALVDGIQGMADLEAFGQGRRQLARIRALGLALAGTQRQMAVISGLQSALSSLLANLGMWVVLILAIPLVETGQIQGVHLAVLALAALTSFEAVTPLPLAAQYLESSLQAARRLFEIVDARPEVQDAAAPAPVPEALGLEVSNLRFRYPPEAGGKSSPWVLDGVSFSLPPGKRLAIVGPSGAGKSTLLSLLLRFWDYEVGQILLNGQDLRDYAQDELRRRIGVVAQNAYLFSASVGDNLRLARQRASQEDISRAAQEAQIDDFIRSLPEGYQTWIGEQGLRLSAGQRQRLAIARALLKDAPLLILDEATANLDAITEREVLKSIYALMEERATLMITHRLVGMEGMDEILVLEKGRVVERGQHANLLAAGGLYQRMWQLQHEFLEET